MLPKMVIVAKKCAWNENIQPHPGRQQWRKCASIPIMARCSSVRMGASTTRKTLADQTTTKQSDATTMQTVSHKFVAGKSKKLHSLLGRWRMPSIEIITFSSHTNTLTTLQIDHWQLTCCRIQFALAIKSLCNHASKCNEITIKLKKDCRKTEKFISTNEMLKLPGTCAQFSHTWIEH